MYGGKMLGKKAEVAFSLRALEEHSNDTEQVACFFSHPRICGSPGFHNPAALTFYKATRAPAVYPHLSPSPPVPC